MVAWLVLSIDGRQELTNKRNRSLNGRSFLTMVGRSAHLFRSGHFIDKLVDLKTE
jgi:hypothetical protein